MADRGRLNIGVIGCGWFAQAVQLPLLSRFPDVAVAAIGEPDAGRRREAGRLAPAAQQHRDYRDVLRIRELDAVIITAPTNLHAEIAIAAMQAGKHVYVEKPMAGSLQEAEAMLAAWRRTGVVGMVGFNYRFNALQQTARRLVRAGAIGPVLGARSVFSTPVRDLPDWKRTRATGGGVLLDLASHHFDLVRFLFHQDVHSVYAEVGSHRTEQDTAAVTLRLAGGLLVQSFFSLCGQDEDRFEIHGETGTVIVDRYHTLAVRPVARRRGLMAPPLWSPLCNPLRRARYAIEKVLSPWHEPSYRLALRAFISAVRGRSIVSPDLADGFRAMHLVAAAEESARKAGVANLSSIALSRAVACGPSQAEHDDDGGPREDGRTRGGRDTADAVGVGSRTGAAHGADGRLEPSPEPTGER